MFSSFPLTLRRIVSSFNFALTSLTDFETFADTAFSVGSQKHLEAYISMGYRLDKYWDAGIGFGIYDHEIESDALRNAIKYNVLMTYVGYSFY